MNRGWIRVLDIQRDECAVTNDHGAARVSIKEPWVTNMWHAYGSYSSTDINNLSSVMSRSQSKAIKGSSSPWLRRRHWFAVMLYDAVWSVRYCLRCGSEEKCGRHKINVCHEIQGTRQFKCRSSVKTNLSKLRLALKKRQLDKYMRRAVWSVCTAATKQPRKKSEMSITSTESHSLARHWSLLQQQWGVSNYILRSQRAARQGMVSHRKIGQVKSGTGQWWYSRCRRRQKLELWKW